MTEEMASKEESLTKKMQEISDTHAVKQQTDTAIKKMRNYQVNIKEMEDPMSFAR